jgi:PIN domain nuclease of toxin-antitoxin system
MSPLLSLLIQPKTNVIEGVIEQHDLFVINFSGGICVRTTQLPDIHKVPFDRLIIATAMYQDTPVI